MAELAPDVLRDARATFGAVLADQMGYSEGASLALAGEVDLSFEGAEVTMRFGWCGREIVASLDHISELREVVEHFALDCGRRPQGAPGAGRSAAVGQRVTPLMAGTAS